MNLNQAVSLAIISIFLAACAPRGAQDNAASVAPSVDLPCGQSDAVQRQEYYGTSREIYRQAGMDDALSSYMAFTATSMMMCIWRGEFSQYQGRSCVVELDFASARPGRRFTGDAGLCSFIEKQIAPVDLILPPANYLQNHKQVEFEFTPG